MAKFDNMVPTELSATNATSLQPKRKNLWYVKFEDDYGIQQFSLKTSGLPGGEFAEITVDYINNKFYFPGKWTWNEVEMTFNDYIKNSVAEKLYTWFRACFNPTGGEMPFSSEIKKDVYIILLSPTGEDIETWTLKGAWPKKFDWGDGLDYSSDDVREVTIGFRYDYAELATQPPVALKNPPPPETENIQ